MSAQYFTERTTAPSPPPNPCQDEFGPLAWPFLPQAGFYVVQSKFEGLEASLHPAHYAVSLHDSPSSTKSS